jgi:hypothetical protein
VNTPKKGAHDRGIIGKGGLLRTVKGKCWFAATVIVLVVFSLALIAAGIFFIYADANAKAWGKDHKLVADLGSHVGVPMLVFGLAFLLATLSSARHFSEDRMDQLIGPPPARGRTKKQISFHRVNSAV